MEMHLKKAVIYKNQPIDCGYHYDSCTRQSIVIQLVYLYLFYLVICFIFSVVAFGITGRAVQALIGFQGMVVSYCPRRSRPKDDDITGGIVGVIRIVD